jgi:hypothetical protein
MTSSQSDILPDITTIDSNSVITLREIFFDDIRASDASDDADANGDDIRASEASDDADDNGDDIKASDAEHTDADTEAKGATPAKRRPWRN